MRPGTDGDVPAVLELLRSCHLPVDGVSGGFGDAYAVAENETGIAGVAGVETYGTSGLFRSAAVAPLQRGRGIGESLTRDRIEWARKRGVTRLFLLTTTAEDYFARFGFERITRDDVPAAVRQSAEFTTVCPSSATVMRLTVY